MGNDLLSHAQGILSDPGALNSMIGHISLYGILAAAFFSLIGFAYFLYGKKSVSYSFLFCGITLMAYPYFISKTVYIVVVGLVVSVIPFVVKI
jgi:hypothetical protein